MQSTGHTSTHERSLTLTHGSAITYGIYDSPERLREYAKVIRLGTTVLGRPPAALSEPAVQILVGISISRLGRPDTGDFRTHQYHRYLWVPSEHAARRKRGHCCSRPVCASLP